MEWKRRGASDRRIRTPTTEGHGVASPALPHQRGHHYDHDECVSGTTNVTVGTKAKLANASEGDTAYALAKKLRGMSASTSVSDVGGSVRILSVSTSSIGLRRTFERPIRVGVPGLILRVNLDEPRHLDGKGRNEWLLADTPAFR